MATVPGVLLLGSYLALMYAVDKTSNPTAEDPIVEAIGEIVQGYEKTLSLYDLLAHFPVDNRIECPESDTRLAYPGDCTRYVTCRDFKAHIRGCPPGMRFDTEVLRCRLPYQAKCNESLEMNRACGTNEEYLECSIGCERTCDEHQNDYVDCPEGCREGCFCREGYVRGPMRNCIHQSKCRSSNTLEPWFFINSEWNADISEESSERE